jgi:hypothetical protein
VPHIEAPGLAKTTYHKVSLRLPGKQSSKTCTAKNVPANQFQNVEVLLHRWWAAAPPARLSVRKEKDEKRKCCYSRSLQTDTNARMLKLCIVEGVHAHVAEVELSFEAPESSRRKKLSAPSELIGEIAPALSHPDRALIRLKKSTIPVQSDSKAQIRRSNST